MGDWPIPLLAPDVVPAGASVAAGGLFVADVGDAGVFEGKDIGQADESADKIHAFGVTHVFDKKINEYRV